MSQDSAAAPAVSKLKISNSLSTHCFSLSLIDEVVSEIRKLPDFQSKRLDAELTKSVVKMVRDAVIESQGKQLTSKQADALDKTELVVCALSKAFGLSEEETTLISNQIDFVMQNRVVSKRVFAKIARKAVSLFKKSR
jgi:hypothetical protein